jgi:hypothetical protein
LRFTFAFHSTDAADGRLVDVLDGYNRNATAMRNNTSWKGQMLLPYANRIGPL